MCGYISIIDKDNALEIDVARRCQRLIQHRGPDSQNEWSDYKSIFLGHNRLSIIDLSDNANQPFFSHRENIAIVFNGEIYNYIKLKQQLGPLDFKSHSDTEVILEGYINEGYSFFEKLEGMYSFAIFDFRAELNVIAFRDPSGIKPLYYLNNNKCFIISSEIKSILPYCKDLVSPNEKVINAYLNLGFCPEPETAYKSIMALKPGTMLNYRFDELNKYPVNLQKFSQSNTLSIPENINKSNLLIDEAVTSNLVGDISPIVALSGGIDSSIIYKKIAHQNNKIEALTVSFDRDLSYDEIKLSTKYSKMAGGKQRIVEISEEFNLEILDFLLDHFDQPYADSSFIPTYLLTKESQKYSKVLIGGDGGDELFAGYPSMKWIYYLYNYQLLTKYLSALMKINLFGHNYHRKMNRLHGIFDETEVVRSLYHRNSWLPKNIKLDNQSIFINNVSNGIDYYENIFVEEKPTKIPDQIVFDYFRKILLSDYLRKTDMMAMLNGVELRVPFLHEKLVQHALSIPFDQKIKYGKTKSILRNIHRKSYNGIGSNREKKGFSIPLDKYLSTSEKKQILFIINKSDSIVSDYITRSYIRFLSDQFINHTDIRNISHASVYQRVLLLYSLDRWYRKL